MTESEIDLLIHGEESRGWTLDERIHETRKTIKRLRSLLRLYRGGLGHATFRREDASLREFGHELSTFRDETALDASFQALVHSAGPDDHGRLTDYVSVLRGTIRGSAPKAEGDAATTLANVGDRLGALRDRSQRLGLDGRGWATLAPGLRHTYARGRRAFTRALAKPGERRLHRFRTWVKRHQYQLELLEPLWPEPIKACRHETKTLGELLGEDHDLALLERRLESLSERRELEAPLAVLARLAEARHGELRRRALELGSRVYAESPKRFLDRYREYFDAWS